MNPNRTGLRQLTWSLYSDTEPSWYGGTIVFTCRRPWAPIWRIVPGIDDEQRQLTQPGAAQMPA